MKKLLLTATIVLSMGLCAFAQQGDGAFRRGGLRTDPDPLTTPSIPSGFSLTSDQNGDPDAPIGSGIAVLMGLGATYALGKRRKE